CREPRARARVSAPMGCDRLAGRMRFFVSGIATWLLVAGVARAQVALPLTEAEDSEIRVDGAIREWNGIRLLDVGWGGDAFMRVALAYSGAGLYVAAEVHDDRVIRDADPGTDEDAVVITLAMPRGRSLDGSELWLWPGLEGRITAAAGIGE